MQTTKKICRAAAVSLLALCLTIPAVSSAAPRKKTPTTITTTEITEAFYDKAWRNFQIGSKKEKAEVIKSLKAIIRKSPEEFMAHYYLGIMTAEEGFSNQAIKHFETALLGFPKSADIHVRIGALLDAKNRTEEAVEHYQNAFKLEPGNAKALARLGIYELENGNLDAANDLLVKARQAQPDNPDTLRGLGAILIEKDSATEALPILEQALLFDQKHPETHWLLARAYEKADNSEKATFHFAEARKFGRKDPEIKELIGYDMARSLVKSGKMKDAEAEYKKEIKKNQDPATGYFELAQLYEDTGRENDAIESYIQAYDLNKALGEGVMKAADIYLQREDYDNAESTLTIIKNDAVFKDKARMALADLKEKRELQEKLRLENNLNDSKNTDAEIEATFYEMLDLNKSDPTALEGLMNFYKERGYYEEALSFFRKYNKVNSGTDYEKKVVEKDLKNRFELDNYTLFNNKKVIPFKDSTADDDNLMNLAFNGDNDRLKEIAFKILLSRTEHKKDRNLVEGLLDFYAERGRTEEALKYVSVMKRLGYYTDSEVTEKRAKLRGK
ncbi:MAG: tetratricopeptide repeat protein [Erysipelotrichia bacterium]|nr:tetratricopeptide repeat protein [Erysipelotrichia bacterium]